MPRAPPAGAHACAHPNPFLARQGSTLPGPMHLRNHLQPLLKHDPELTRSSTHAPVSRQVSRDQEVHVTRPPVAQSNRGFPGASHPLPADIYEVPEPRLLGLPPPVYPMQ